MPPAILALIQALNAAIAAAQPLGSATQATMTALATQAAGLVEAVEAAIAADYGGLLDTWTGPAMAPAIAAGLLSVYADGAAQLSLADVAGFAGRMATNLANG
jgi:hypothetical protein